jgi:hypothetical protein
MIHTLKWIIIHDLAGTIIAAHPSARQQSKAHHRELSLAPPDRSLYISGGSSEPDLGLFIFYNRIETDESYICLAEKSLLADAQSLFSFDSESSDVSSISSQSHVSPAMARPRRRERSGFISDRQGTYLVVRDCEISEYLWFAIA